MIDPNNYILRVWDLEAKHLADYRLTEGMLMALSQLGLLQRKVFSVKQPKDKPSLTATILHSTNFKWGGKYRPDNVKVLDKLHIMPDRWLSFDEVYEGMLWSSEYLVRIRRESGAMVLSTKQEIPQNQFIWTEQRGLDGPVDIKDITRKLVETEASISAVKWFKNAPVDLQDWMLQEITLFIKSFEQLENV